MTEQYDAIVVGARCAGSPTAMLLARRGYRVLVVDHATFPSDTLSTHVIHATGVAALRRWGLLDRVVATGCPPLPHYTFDFGPVTIRGTARPVDGHSTAYAPRRTVLDKILVDAAREAGAEVREGFSVDGIVTEDGRVTGIRGRAADGTHVVEHARVVVGADGRQSRVVRAVDPEQYHEKPPLQTGYYAYWSNLPVEGFEIFIRPYRGWAAVPTNDGLTLVVGGWPYAETAANKRDIEGNFLKMMDLAPDFARRLRGARRETRFAGGFVPGYLRKPFGPGWVLVGDAGYNKDPITAQGISDAFRDAERATAALDEAFTGARTFDDAMADYQRERDAAALPVYEFTAQLATMEPPPPQMQQLFAAMQGNQEAMDGFAGVVAGTVSPVEFFDPANLGRILGSMPAGVS